MKEDILIRCEFIDRTFGFVLISFGTNEFRFAVFDNRKLVAD